MAATIRNHVEDGESLDPDAVRADQRLHSTERETNIRFDHQRGAGRRAEIFSEIPTNIRKMILHPEISVNRVRRDNDGFIVAAWGTMPVGLVSVNSYSRKDDGAASVINLPDDD